MKKLTPLILGLALLLGGCDPSAVVSEDAAVAPKGPKAVTVPSVHECAYPGPCGPFELYADQDVLVGAVEVLMTLEDVTVVITLTETEPTLGDPWSLQSSHLYLAAAPPGSAAPGLFPFHHGGLGSVMSDTYVIPYDALGASPDDPLFIAVHTEVHAMIDPGLCPNGSGEPTVQVACEPVFRDETAWAFFPNGEQFPTGWGWLGLLADVPRPCPCWTAEELAPIDWEAFSNVAPYTELVAGSGPIYPENLAKVYDGAGYMSNCDFRVDGSWVTLDNMIGGDEVAACIALLEAEAADEGLLP